MINLLWFLNIYALKVVLRSKVILSQFLTIELLVTTNIMYEQKPPLMLMLTYPAPQGLNFGRLENDVLFCFFDLSPSKQFLSYVETGLPGFKQY